MANASITTVKVTNGRAKTSTPSTMARRPRKARVRQLRANNSVTPPVEAVNANVDMISSSAACKSTSIDAVPVLWSEEYGFSLPRTAKIKNRRQNPASKKTRDLAKFVRQDFGKQCVTIH